MMKDTLRLVTLAAIMGFAVSYVLWGRNPNAAPKDPDVSSRPAQKKPDPGAKNKLKVSKLRLEPTSQNLGTVNPDTTHKLNFVVHNPTEAPIQITKVVPGCGCVDTKLEKELIPPNSFTNLTATYSASRNKPGDNVAIRLHTNEKGSPYLTAHVEAKIFNAIQTIPRITHFRDMMPGETKVKTFIVKHAKGKNFEIKGISKTKPYLSFKVDPEIKDVRSSYKVTVTCTAPKDPVTHKDTCGVVTNLETAKVSPVEVHVTVLGPYVVTPPSLGGRVLDDGSVAPPMKISLSRRQAGEPIVITSVVESFSRPITYTLSKKADSIIIDLKFKEPLPTNRTTTGAFLIYTKEDYVKFPLTVRYQIFPEIRSRTKSPTQKSEGSKSKAGKQGF